MSKILTKYYEGILSQLRGEVDFVNEVFTHEGLKGEGNETAIRDLITKFIPRRYGVGSGIVIDRDGNTSKQSDIVIYDNHNYPEVFSMTSTHLYPIDFVYATIEVKTTLNSSKARQAIENIKSVRSLNYIKDSFRVYPIDPVDEITAETELWRTTSTNAPIGIVFGYRSNTAVFDTFAAWFTKDDEEETSFWPSYVFCLDQGLIVAPGWGKYRTARACPAVYQNDFRKADAEVIRKVNGTEWGEISGRLFPLTEIESDKYLIDQSKLLLNFVLILSELLAKKFLSPRISFRENYLTDELSELPIVVESTT